MEDKANTQTLNKHTRYSTFAEFYPYYLTEHSDPFCRRLHFVGTYFAI